MKNLSLALAMILASFNLNAQEAIAKFKGKDVSKAEVETWLKDKYPAELLTQAPSFSEIPTEAQKAIIREYIVSKTLADEAKNAKIAETKEYKDKLKDVSEKLEISVYLENISKTSIKDEEVRNEYSELLKNIKLDDELKVRHILLKSEEDAKKTYEELKKGADFIKLMNQKSEDQKTKSLKDPSTLARGQSLIKYEETAFGLKIGEFSKPIKTEAGWFIIKLEGREKQKAPSYEELKPQLENQVRMKFANSKLQEIQNQITFSKDLEKQHDAKQNQKKVEENQNSDMNNKK